MTNFQIKSHAFQNGLDSVYDQWDSSKIAQFTMGLQQEHGEFAVNSFKDGVKTAEEQCEME